MEGDAFIKNVTTGSIINYLNTSYQLYVFY